MQQVNAVSLYRYGRESAWSRGVLQGFLFRMLQESCYRSVGRVVLNPSPATGRSRIDEEDGEKRQRM